MHGHNAPPPVMNQAMYQQQMMNQSMVSSAASSTAPLHADIDHVRKYFAEIQTMFTSQEFKTSDR